MPASPSRVRLIATAVASVTAATAVAVGVATAGTGGHPRATNPGFGYGYNCAGLGGFGYGYGFNTTPCPSASATPTATHAPTPTPSATKTTTPPPPPKAVSIKRGGHLRHGKQIVFDITNIKPGAIDTIKQYKPVKNKNGKGYHYVFLKTYVIKAFTGGNIHYGVLLNFLGQGKSVVTVVNQKGESKTFVLLYLVH